MSLLICAALLFVIAQARRVRGRPDWRPWLGLAVLFVLLSLDEMASLHEMASGTLRRLFHLEGAFYFAWVLPAGVGLILLGLLYVRFLWRLPSRTRSLFLAAALLYVGGALGMELVGGALVTQYGFHDIRYFWAATVEEFCEMMGVVVFIFALLDYLRRENIHLVLSPSPDSILL